MEATSELSPRQLAPVAAVRLDGNGRIAEASEAAAVMLGMAPEELHGLTLGDLAADQWRALADSATARILFGDDRIFQLLLSGKGGQRVLVQMASQRHTVGASFMLAWSEHSLEFAPIGADPDVSEMRRLANRLLRNHEAERRRITVDLDSGVSPLVVVARFMVEDSIQRLDSATNPEAIELLRNASARLRQALGELQRVSLGLRPKLLDDLGLLPTIEWFCRVFEGKNRAIRVERQLSVGETDIPDQLKLVIFRLVEEALNNVARHANASEVQIVVMRIADELLTWVQDNGDGFETAPSMMRPPRGIGLASIRRRIEATGGQLALQSSLHNGTRVGAKWKLPVQAGEP